MSNQHTQRMLLAGSICPVVMGTAADNAISFFVPLGVFEMQYNAIVNLLLHYQN
jgi:hypothetical protein